jgi:hypothetical protein
MWECLAKMGRPCNDQETKRLPMKKRSKSRDGEKKKNSQRGDTEDSAENRKRSVPTLVSSLRAERSNLA